MRKNKRQNPIAFDPLTQRIHDSINKIPRLGDHFARFYLWKFMMFNFMLVGATGLIISWLIYELGFRILFVDVWQLGGLGSFLGMMLTTTLVFMWNYELNRRWSLNSDAQIMKMGIEDLKKLRKSIDRLLEQKEHELRSSN